MRLVVDSFDIDTEPIRDNRADVVAAQPLSPTRIAPVATLRQLDATIPVTKKRNTTEKFQ